MHELLAVLRLVDGRRLTAVLRLRAARERQVSPPPLEPQPSPSAPPPRRPRDTRRPTTPPLAALRIALPWSSPLCPFPQLSRRPQHIRAARRNGVLAVGRCEPCEHNDLTFGSRRGVVKKRLLNISNSATHARLLGQIFEGASRKQWRIQSTRSHGGGGNIG